MTPRLASASARSLPGWPLWPLTQCHSTVCFAAIASSSRQSSAFLTGFRAFFADSAADPLVVSLLSGSAKTDLLQIITTDSAPIITHCSRRLAEAFLATWVHADPDDAGVLARAIVRLALSYVSMPPEADHDVAADLARLMTPFAERHGATEPA